MWRPLSVLRRSYGILKKSGTTKAFRLFDEVLFSCGGDASGAVRRLGLAAGGIVVCGMVGAGNGHSAKSI